MQASPSSSCNSGTTTSLSNRLSTVFKKAYELSILCEIEVCVIYYGLDGKLKTWPPEREKVKDMALRYKEATKRKKSHNLDDFLDKMKYRERKNKSLKKKTLKYPDWYPIFDHYSPNQLSLLIQSLEVSLFKLQERLRFVEAQKQRKTNLIYHQDQNQPALNPSQFSLYMYNHEDATLSQLPLSSSHSNQPTNLPLSSSHSNQLTNLPPSSHSNQLTNYEYHLMQQENMYMDNITNTQPYSALLSVQEPAVNHLMQQQELYACHQNMCLMSNITNNNVPLISYTVPHSDFQKIPYDDAVGNSFSQDMLSSYDASTSSLPSLRTIPNSYGLSDTSRFF